MNLYQGLWPLQLKFIKSHPTKITQDYSIIIFLTNVMHEKSTVNNRKNKEPIFVTPFSRPELRQSIEEEPQICLQHSQPLQFICFSCDNKILCSHCISLSTHPQHDLKHLQKSKQFFRGEFQEWLIRLDSKSERLDIVYEQLSSTIAETYISAQKYKDQIYRQLCELIDLMKESMTEISNSLTKFYNQYTHEVKRDMEQIRLKRQEIQTFNRTINDKVESATVIRLAQLYNEKKDIFQSFLNQEQINVYKQRLVQPNWGVDATVLSDIRCSINNLTLKLCPIDLHQQGSEIHQKQQQISKVQKKKIKRMLKLSDLQKPERRDLKIKKYRTKASNSLKSILTPKKQSKQQKIKNKKSPEISLLKKTKISMAKMVSMPVSPSKTLQNTHQITPELSRQKLVFKKRQK